MEVPPEMQGVEATLFAALMSILNGGAFAGSFLGSLLTRALGVDGQDFTNLAPLVYTLYCLMLLLPCRKRLTACHGR
jgi:BT1 family